MTTMKLIGRNLSPYTRRVAIALTLLDIPHEREYLSVTADPQRGLSINPVGRVPALQISASETLIESAAILDYLMELAGPKTLVPPHGKPRRDCLRLMAWGAGVLDKAVAAIYEVRRRPAEKVHEPWRQLLLSQATGGLRALEAVQPHPWLMGEHFSMADVTVGVTVSFLRVMQPELLPPGVYPNLEALATACEALPAFKAHPLETP
ncbi:glutathione S-transferase family protein [Ferrovibrio sp.]|uniref:glutathione S-transferase family protein n=1 Tax=Ferrovibrio sp. TaxID=1917215 RepID=UPI003D0C3D53